MPFSLFSSNPSTVPQKTTLAPGTYFNVPIQLMITAIALGISIIFCVFICCVIKYHEWRENRDRAGDPRDWENSNEPQEEATGNTLTLP